MAGFQRMGMHSIMAVNNIIKRGQRRPTTPRIKNHRLLSSQPQPFKQNQVVKVSGRLLSPVLCRSKVGVGKD